MKKGKSQHLLKSLSLISLKISRIPLMLLRKLHPKTWWRQESRLKNILVK